MLFSTSSSFLVGLPAKISLITSVLALAAANIAASCVNFAKPLPACLAPASLSLPVVASLYLLIPLNISLAPASRYGSSCFIVNDLSM